VGIAVAARKAARIGLSLALFLVDHALQHEIGQPHDKRAKPGIFFKEGHHVGFHSGVPVGIVIVLKCGSGNLIA